MVRSRNTNKKERRAATPTVYLMNQKIYYSLFIGLLFMILPIGRRNQANATDLGEKVKKIYTIADIELGRSTIEDVLKKWGGQPVSGSNDKYICYILRSPKKVYFVIGSDESNTVNLFSFSYRSITPPFVKCDPVQPKGIDKIETENGVTLGMPKMEMRAILGKPSKNLKFSAERYCWDSAIRLPNGNFVHESPSVVVRFRKNKVDELQITFSRERFSEATREDYSGKKALSEIKELYGREKLFMGKPNQDSCYENFIESAY